MRRFGKVVLSRKGFDSIAGGDYSPFDPETGKYVVLPIPVDDDERAISNSLKYEDIHIQSDCLPDYAETNLKSLMKALGKKATIKSIESDKRIQSEYAHFDPWLVNCPWLEGDSKHPIGAFGQVGGPQTHLDKQDVGKGTLPSLFLFFSRFKPITNRENIMLHNIISREHLNKGLYFIYGWLRIRETIKRYEDIDISIDDPELKREVKERHPHATKSYFAEKGNTIYIANKFLLDDTRSFAGCGYFPKLTEKLLLTATDSSQKPEWIPSRWKMPPGFSFQTCKSVFNEKAKWDNTDYDGSYLVKTGWQWQEAVFDEDESEEFYKWFCGLLK